MSCGLLRESAHVELYHVFRYSTICVVFERCSISYIGIIRYRDLRTLRAMCRGRLLLSQAEARGKMARALGGPHLPRWAAFSAIHAEDHPKAA